MSKAIASSMFVAVIGAILGWFAGTHTTLFGGQPYSLYICIAISVLVTCASTFFIRPFFTLSWGVIGSVGFAVASAFDYAIAKTSWALSGALFLGWIVGILIGTMTGRAHPEIRKH